MNGSLSKAGKVRQQTPKIQGKKRKKKNPRVCNRDKYEKRIEEKRKTGQPERGRRY